MISASLSVLLQDSSSSVTIGEFFDRGGLMMWPILGCSVVVLALSIERGMTTRRRNVLPANVRAAVDEVCAGRAAAVEPQIAESRSAGARVLAAGLRRRGYPLADIERAMSDQMAREGSQMRANVRVITLMAAVAPLCGLLGTVLGIARAFAATELSGANRAELLASGIGVALYTTIFGLIVAIPATLVAGWLQARARNLVIMLDDALTPAIEPLSRATPAPAAKDGSHAA